MPTWYLILWALILVLAIFSKSLVACLAMIFVWALGTYYAMNLETIEVIRLGIVGVFVLGMGYSALEMVIKVNKF